MIKSFFLDLGLSPHSWQWHGRRYEDTVSTEKVDDTVWDGIVNIWGSKNDLPPPKKNTPKQNWICDSEKLKIRV